MWMSMKAAYYFKLFSSDIVLSGLVKFANDNAELTKRTEPQKNKGEWKKLTLEEIKAYCGILIMKVILRLDCDAHFWHTGAEHFLLSTEFGGIMSRDGFFQFVDTCTSLIPRKMLTVVTSCTRFGTFLTPLNTASQMNTSHISR